MHKVTDRSVVNYPGSIWSVGTNMLNKFLDLSKSCSSHWHWISLNDLRRAPAWWTWNASNSSYKRSIYWVITVRITPKFCPTTRIPPPRSSKGIAVKWKKTFRYTASINEHLSYISRGSKSQARNTNWSPAHAITDETMLFWREGVILSLIKNKLHRKGSKFTLVQRRSGCCHRFPSQKHPIRRVDALNRIPYALKEQRPRSHAARE